MSPVALRAARMRTFWGKQKVKRSVDLLVCCLLSLPPARMKPGGKGEALIVRHIDGFVKGCAQCHNRAWKAETGCVSRRVASKVRVGEGQGRAQPRLRWVNNISTVQ